MVTIAAPITRLVRRSSFFSNIVIGIQLLVFNTWVDNSVMEVYHQINEKKTSDDNKNAPLNPGDVQIKNGCHQ